MFTGIITEIGTLLDARASDGGLDLDIACSWTDLADGESIAVDGACLTVARRSGQGFGVHVVRTSLDRTRFGDLRPGHRLNLERALRVGDRLGGHLVQGHVDGTASVVDRRDLADHRVLAFSVPPALETFLVEKGSVTVDGVSLTVSALGSDRFEVALIPHTLEVTTLDRLVPGDRVNLEVDVLAKYVQRALAARGLVPGLPGSGNVSSDLP